MLLAFRTQQKKINNGQKILSQQTDCYRSLHHGSSHFIYRSDGTIQDGWIQQLEVLLGAAGLYRVNKHVFHKEKTALPGKAISYRLS